MYENEVIYRHTRFELFINIRKSIKYKLEIMNVNFDKHILS